MANVLCITGMHRSGTSLTASWLEQCGLPIHAGRVVSPGDGNPRGHFEDLDMEWLHAAAMHRLGLTSMGLGLPVARPTPTASGLRLLDTWRALPQRRAGAVRRLGLSPVGPGMRGEQSLVLSDDEVVRAGALIAERNNRFPIWGWKDPRSLLFLDAWRSLLPGLKVLVVWRPAADVVDSLLRRAKKSSNPDMQARLWPSIGLWHSYNTRALAYCRRHRDSTLLLPVSRVVADDQAVLGLIEDRFGIPLRRTALSSVYEERLLRRRDTSTGLTALRACARLRGCAALERELQAMSDALGTGSPS